MKAKRIALSLVLLTAVAVGIMVSPTWAVTCPAYYCVGGPVVGPNVCVAPQTCYQGGAVIPGGPYTVRWCCINGQWVTR